MYMCICVCKYCTPYLQGSCVWLLNVAAHNTCTSCLCTCTFLSWHEYFQCQGNRSPYLDMPRLVHTLLPLPEIQTHMHIHVHCKYMYTYMLCVAYNICIGIDLGSCIHNIQFLAMFICLNKKQELKNHNMETYIHPNTYTCTYIYTFMYMCSCTLKVIYTAIYSSIVTR